MRAASLWRTIVNCFAFSALISVSSAASAQERGGGIPQHDPRGNQSGHDTKAQKTVVIIGASTGYGISYLPLLLMQEKKLLAKHAAALGLDVALRFQRFPTAAPMFDALVSGKIDFAAGGVTQLLTSWDRTRADPDLRIKGVGSLNAMPLDLVTSNPQVKTVADFTNKDRIAVVAVRTSIEAVVLAMAAEKALGKKHADEIDALTVPLSHRDSMAALLGGKSGVDAHVASAPFIYQELEDPKIHKVFDSYDVLGGPHTHNVVWTTSKFHSDNRKLYAAFVDALQEALDQIKADPAGAAALYIKLEDVKDMTARQAESIITKPENEWTMVPEKFVAFATFMKHEGLISAAPNNWRNLFFDNVSKLPGS